MRRLRVTSLVAVCLTLIVIGVGVFTRLSDAGLGCPDWPACYGHFIVPKNTNAMRSPIEVKKAQIEMGHRYVAGVLTVVIFAVALLSILAASFGGISFLLSALTLLFLLSYQIVLGMWTVTMKLAPWVVMQHLIVGVGILSVLWLIYLRAKHHANHFVVRTVSVKLRMFGMLCFILLFLQIILGGWTSSHYAGLICRGVLACDPVRTAHHLTASDTTKITIQMTHRFGAVIVSVALLILFFWIRFAYRDFLPLRKVAHYLVMFLVIQIALGMFNVALQLPILIALIHNLMAAIMLLTLVTINFYLNRVRC
ncbi:MAG: hypothetical protein A3C44_08205 [Gammaproteobacteria bacterium RIFCSPHIGHO2_02_FULL_39_13]|nr:MAG: hypothetical protein A3C44_08205 [Gammaproteobacteria bacterium RIFCSPHIGHO2_02_FULL_39_13]OGT50613.1 MAG: hypothetical protein A3E53_03615 [Gammaproteobacteria bacterium RIFCSPHIGHO2_12_FULL_39_24]